LEIGHIKALGESLIDGRQQRAGLIITPPIAPKPRQTRCRAQLQELGALRARDIQRSMEALFALRRVFAKSSQQLSLESVHLGFGPAGCAFLDDAQRLVDQA